jgi:cell fate (sporulation/competence/biofilm development) regulator YlbF (YheA/YmcA/DUF963 family)
MVGQYRRKNVLMNIQTVASNLRTTIAGKEKYLSEVYEQREVSNGDDIVSFVTAQMLEFNIDELKRILQDVEQCIKVEV